MFRDLRHVPFIVSSRVCILLPPPVTRATQMHIQPQGGRETASTEGYDTCRQEKDRQVLPSHGFQTRVNIFSLALLFFVLVGCFVDTIILL